MTKAEFRFRFFLPREDPDNNEIEVWVDELYGRNDPYGRSKTEWVEQCLPEYDLHDVLGLPADAIRKSWQIVGHGTLESNDAALDDYEESLELVIDEIREEPEYQPKLTRYTFTARQSNAHTYSMSIVAVDECKAVALAEKICRAAGLEFVSIAEFVSWSEDD